MYLSTILPIILSLAAFGLSLLAFLQQRTDGSRLSREQLTATLTSMYDVTGEQQILMVEMNQGFTQAHNIKAAFLNERLAYLVRQSQFLIGQIPKLVTDVEYAAIARALASVNDIVSAEQFHHKAIHAAPNGLFTSIHLRGYAMFLFGIGRYNEGRQQLRLSVTLSTGDKNGTNWNNLTTYIYWARLEEGAYQHDEATQRFQDAERSLQRIEAPPLRDAGYRMLFAERKAVNDMYLARMQATVNPQL